MRPDLILEARAFVQGTFDDYEIGLNTESGTILAVKKNLPGSPRKRYPGRLLIPSGVDLHVHFRDPGAPHKEDFKTGTRGAVMGGIGTVFDMPNTKPVVDTVRVWEEKREAVASKACCDFGLWCTLTEKTREPARLLRNASGAKLYLAPTTGIEAPATTEELRARLELAHAAQRLVVLHAERDPGKVPTTLAQHGHVRSVEGEAVAVREVANLAGAEAAIHVAHASTADTVEAALASGFSVAATPHHLLLAHDEHPLGAFGKVNPPLRDHRERTRLWEAFAAGRIPILESDHAPHTIDEKSRPFSEAPAGVPGVETGFPLLLRQAKEHGVAPDLVIRAYAEAPAARLGLKKGRLEAGYDADFFLLDPKSVHRVKGSALASKCAWTPFEDWSTYRVETHYLRGDLVVEDHHFIGRPGQGRILSPTSPPVPFVGTS